LLDQLAENSTRKERFAATGGVVGALLASSCCILPLLLITLGASGPWIGKLTALKAYQPLFVGLTAAFLGYGFWHVYWKSELDCDAESCATPRSDRVVKVALWTATALVIVALTTDLWAPLFY
jgi:mercuric ion transport protein